MDRRNGKKQSILDGLLPAYYGPLFPGQFFPGQDRIRLVGMAVAGRGVRVVVFEIGDGVWTPGPGVKGDPQNETRIELRRKTGQSSERPRKDLLKFHLSIEIWKVELI
jgi:hypothetical protein